MTRMFEELGMRVKILEQYYEEVTGHRDHSYKGWGQRNEVISMVPFGEMGPEETDNRIQFKRRGHVAVDSIRYLEGTRAVLMSEFVGLTPPPAGYGD